MMKKEEKTEGVKCRLSMQSESAKKRNGQTKPPRRKTKGVKE